MGKNNNVYILSLEGAKVWEHMNRGGFINGDYVGMIPYSLELEKLQKSGLKTFTSNRNNKIMSKDIINVKFNQKVRSAEEIIKIINKKLKSDVDKDYKTKLIDYVKVLQNEKESEKWKEIKNEELRNKLYDEGFTIAEVDKKTGEVKETKYVAYKRSSAKSRTGQVLFIREKLHDKMIKWGRIGMNLDGRDDIDYPSLLSYESLVSSSLEDTVHIDVDNILIVEDVISKFAIDVNIVEKDKDGLLISKTEKNYGMENDLFDGEGLADISIFRQANREEKGMMLLRNHMFKSCVFNTNLQQFLKDNCPIDDYEEWELEDMFGNKILAKDVKMVITPNSLKALKFSKIKGSKPKMYKHWKKTVKKEGNVFGICKSEKPSQRGINEQGDIVNQTSYQMLNSMPISSTDMKKLSQFELDYIDQLKNDDNAYVEYLLENANDMNCNEMLANLYKRNKDITHTKMFKNIRKKDINKYITHIQKGKVRLEGDYLTILGNPIEYLYHVLGKKVNVEVLKDNEVYTTQHQFNREYVAFRNPHTSPSNVLIVKNKQCDFLEKYFNLSKNIICVNAIDFPIQRILSGADYDSDTLILFNNSVLLENAKRCYKHYRVCVNNVDTDLNKYKVCSKDMAKIDNILANSQKYIGRVVNLGQLYMSTYWDIVNQNCGAEETLKQLMEKVDVCTVLSEIAIDSAKRMYDVDIKKQIDDLEKNKLLYDNKPLFFKYISKNENLDEKLEKYETSMDYLQEIMGQIEAAKGRETIYLEKLLKDLDGRKVKNRQVEGIINIITGMTNKIKFIETKYNGKNEESDIEEKYNKIDEVKNEHMSKVLKYKIKAETIYVIINKVFRGEVECKYKTDLLNALYKTDKEIFLSTFKEK